MLPIYFLSIALNAVVGYILTFGKEEAEGEALSLNVDSETTRLLVGVLAAVTGLLKILSPVAGSVPVVGDLVPALTALGGGFILAFEYFRRRNTVHSLSAERIEGLIAKNRKLAGFVCLGAAAIHLIFYPVLFL